jgi:diguanylate cyclase (GGDEF)-like protein
MPDSSGSDAARVLDALLSALDEGALVFDAAGSCRFAGRRAAEVLGLDATSLLGVDRAELLGAIANATDAPAALAPLDGNPGSDRTVVDPIALARPVTIPSATASGPMSGHFPRTLVWTSVPVAGSHGRLDLIRDVTRERRAESAVEELTRRIELESTLDDLTGLVNRRRFDEECLREHRRAQREWVTYAVACVDVDDMAGINERAGRAIGDALLKRIGDGLRASRREYDVVARWQDDEFVMLLPRADARALGSILRRALAAVHTAGRAVVPEFHVGIGAAIWTPPSAEGPGDVLRRARAALGVAKGRGQGKVEVDLASGEWTDGDLDEPTRSSSGS